MHDSKARYRLLACFTPNTTISGMFFNDICDIGKGDSVFGRSKIDNEVLDKLEREYNGDLYSIKARYILPFECTSEHPVLITKVKRNDNYDAFKAGRRPKKTEWRVGDSEWINAEDIRLPKDRKYDKVCVSIPRIKPTIKYPMLEFPFDADTAWFFGMYIAEGWVSGGTVYFGLHEDEVEYQNRLKNILSRFNINSKIRRYPDSKGVSLYACNTRLAKFLKKYFGSGAKNKTIPREIFMCSDDELVQGVVKGYLDGDGYFHEESQHIRVKTVSKTLAFQIQLLFARWGWFISLGERKYKPNIYRGRVIQGSVAYELQTSYPPAINGLGYHTEHKIRDYGFVTDDALLCPITKISKRHYSGVVHNLSTEDETIIANNVVTHNCGVRWGKSFSAALECLNAMRIPDSRYWIVAPNYELTEKVFRELHAMVVNSPLREYVEKESYHNKFLKFVWDSEVYGKSADSPISLAGEKLDGVIIDEAPGCKEEIWTHYIRERLTDMKGWALFIGTPRGRNWYYNMFLKGQDPLAMDYDSFHFTTYDNPYIDDTEIEAAKAELGSESLAFKQEYMAEFLSDNDCVFRHVQEAVRDTLRDPAPGCLYVAGVDLAKYVDYTVVTIADVKTNHVVFFDRWHKTDWNITYDRIAAAIKKYNNASAWVDSTGIGDPIYETLRNPPFNLHVKPFKFTNQSKQQLVDNLAWFFENAKIHIPEVPELINELNIFEYTVNPKTGRTTFNAPEGYHDDCVSSLGLCAMGLSRGGDVFIGDLDLTKV